MNSNTPCPFRNFLSTNSPSNFPAVSAVPMIASRITADLPSPTLHKEPPSSFTAVEALKTMIPADLDIRRTRITVRELEWFGLVQKMPRDDEYLHLRSSFTN